MKRKATILVILAALAIGTAAFAEAPTVSEKKDLAVFSLGYYGWNIPLEALGSIDSGIQRVFTDLGRFNTIGMTQRLSSGGLDQFIAAVKKSKESNFVMPEKYQFGEAAFTEAEFNRLLGAFIVATPVITSFSSAFDYSSNRWKTELSTDVSFLDVASGSLIGVASVKTSGSDDSNQVKSVQEAIDGIPAQLQFQIRSIPAFQINTRILATSRGEVKIQLGRNMGIVKGDEYSIFVMKDLGGLKDEREVGLVLIKDVGPEISTATVIYANEALGPEDQLREIPRLGTDIEPFLHVLIASPVGIIPGVRVSVSRGFYGFKPAVVASIPIGLPNLSLGVGYLPVNLAAGGQYDLHLGRITLTPWAAVGLTYVRLDTASQDSSSSGSSSQNLFTNIGGEAYLQVSYLSSRDMRFFVEAGGEYWIATSGYASSFGGLGLGAGAAFKL